MTRKSKELSKADVVAIVRALNAAWQRMTNEQRGAALRLLMTFDIDPQSIQLSGKTE